MSSEMTPELQLPGFRFHPTEEELLEFYLKSVVLGKRLRCDIIEFLNIYRHDPWELPGLSKIGEREWYFFVPRDKKHGSGGRPNRTTDKGFWKATGSDRKIVSLSDPKRIIGLRKTLVFYIGRAPRGTKTDWVMNEYRLPDNRSKLLKDIVLCKIYRKATSLKVLEQRAAMEDDQLKMRSNANSPEFSSSPPSSMDTIMSFSSSQQQEREHHLDLTAQIPMMPTINHVVFKKEDAALAVEDQQKEEEEQAMEIKEYYSPPIQVPFGKDELPDLLVPKMSMDWTQDQFWAPMNSPWLLTPYANLLNF